MADQFLTPTNPYDEQARRLEERRRIARQMVERAHNSGGAGYHGGRVFMVGNQLGNVAQALAGAYAGNTADADLKELVQKRMSDQDAWQQQFGAAQDPAEKQRLLADAANKGLRHDLEKQFMDDEAKRIEAGEQAAAQRVEKAQEAEANRAFLEQQKALDRQNRLDARATPTVHITNGGTPQGFGGTATQFGTDPLTNAPIFRHTKSGQLFQYGPDGQPVAHEGAVAPKAASGQPTESERSSAGYLGRMEAAEGNLTDAKPLNFAKQQGLNRAPGLTNFTLTPAEQVTRQQQEDWVRAKLRKESGAVIGDEEMAREIRTYFPQSGDSPAVLRQKAQSRAQALEQMKSSAGRAKPTTAATVDTPKTVVREVKLKDGRIGVEYSDGSRGYKQ